MRHKYKKRQPKRPQKTLSDTEVLISASLNCLYAKQREFWRAKLTSLISRNLELLGRRAHPRLVGIHYAGRAWFRPWMEAKEAKDFTITRVHPDLEKEAITITSHLAELETEQYEVGRFLAGLLLFPAPSHAIKTILGQELIEEIEREEKVSFDSLGCSTGIINNQVKALQTYAEDHDYIVSTMRERILAKIILSQQLM